MLNYLKQAAWWPTMKQILKQILNSLRACYLYTFQRFSEKSQNGIAGSRSNVTNDYTLSWGYIAIMCSKKRYSSDWWAIKERRIAVEEETIDCHSKENSHNVNNAKCRNNVKNVKKSQRKKCEIYPFANWDAERNQCRLVRKQ